VELVDPLVQAQLKTYDEALSLFHQQKFAKAKQELEKVIEEKTGIQAMKAKNELAQLLSQDQTEFNRALVTAQAAVRKAGGSGAKIDPAVLWWMEQELKEMSKYKPSGKK